MVQFVMDGKITEDGQKAIHYLETQVKAAQDDLAKLNALPGFVQHYHINVMATRLMTPAQWLEDYRNAGAKAAYDYAVQLEEAGKKEAARDEADNKIAEALAEVQKQLAEALAEIKTLKEADKPAKKQPAKKAAEQDEATDAEDKE